MILEMSIVLIGRSSNRSGNRSDTPAIRVRVPASQQTHGRIGKDNTAPNVLHLPILVKRKAFGDRNDSVGVGNERHHLWRGKRK